MSTARRGKASRRPRRSSSCTRRRCATGVGRSTRRPAGSRRTSTGRTSTWRVTNESCCRRSASRPSSTRARPNSKWLNEISHRHPLWIHPSDAEALGIEDNGLVRITTRIGHFVIQAWRTEGIRPGVVAASHHMGRWRLDDDTARSWSQRPRPPLERRDDVDTAPDTTDGPAGLRRAPTTTPHGSGGTTPASTRTSRSRCNPTRSQGCTAGTSGCT